MFIFAVISWSLRTYLSTHYDFDMTILRGFSYAVLPYGVFTTIARQVAAEYVDNHLLKVGAVNTIPNTSFSSQNTETGLPSKSGTGQASG